MIISNRKPDCDQARATDMVDYLCHLGHEPQKIRGNDYWYRSPFRNEKTPSFKVNRRLNRWYDHGIGKGGNLIDFAVLYHRCSVVEFLAMLAGGNILPAVAPMAPPIGKIAEPKIEVLTYGTLKSQEQLCYLKERKIDLEVSLKYCQEITYSFGSKKYEAIGFRNDQGGWEIRNRYFKGSSSPKGITHLKNGAASLLVFEGFFDFLSYLSITRKMDIPEQDYLIFNGLAFASQLLGLLDGYESCRLFLDNDTAGRNCTSALLSLDKRIKDESAGYRPYKDLNDFLLVCPIKGKSENR